MNEKSVRGSELWVDGNIYTYPDMAQDLPSMRYTGQYMRLNTWKAGVQRNAMSVREANDGRVVVPVKANGDSSQNVELHLELILPYVAVSDTQKGDSVSA